MKTLHTKTLKDGRVHVLIELGPTEAMPVPAYKDEAMYRLAYPLEDVVPGHIVKDAQRVYWCPVGQEWVEA